MVDVDASKTPTTLLLESSTIIGLVGGKCNNELDISSSLLYFASETTTTTPEKSSSSSTTKPKQNLSKIKSLKSCEELNFPRLTVGNAARKKSSTSNSYPWCIQYRFWFESERRTHCKPGMTLPASISFCTRLGARLCEFDEIQILLKEESGSTSTPICAAAAQAIQQQQQQQQQRTYINNDNSTEVSFFWTGSKGCASNKLQSFYKVVLNGGDLSCATESFFLSSKGFVICCGDVKQRECDDLLYTDE
jgi:hypothetical protein